MYYSTDPAAVFMQLYDKLPEQTFTRREPSQWDNDSRVKIRASRVYEHIIEHGEADPQQVEEIVQSGGNRGLFTVLRGIDWALAHINPFTPAFDHGKLAWLAARYAETGRLNDGAPEAEGALLPRCSYPGRPRGTRDKSGFFGLHRVSAESWVKVRHERIMPRYQPHFQPDQEIPVGCAPLLETFDDIRLDFLEQDGESVYSLIPVESGSLRKRITSVIDRLDDSEARIAVIPEATLTDALLSHWEDAAYSTAGRHKPLRWILVGSGPLGEDNPPPNRAVLLDRWTKHSLLVQDKIAGFTLTAGQASDWNLPGRPVNGSAAEYISSGSAIAVAESSLGRLAVVICEDLNQSVGWEREAGACGISHLLVPIFSKPIIQYRWEQIATERQIANLGAWLIIANSLVVQRAMGTKLQNSDCYTCLIAGPGDPDRASYQYDLQFGLARAGDDLGKILLNEDLVLPVIHAAVFHDRWLGSGRKSGP